MDLKTIAIVIFVSVLIAVAISVGLSFLMKDESAVTTGGDGGSEMKAQLEALKSQIKTLGTGGVSEMKAQLETLKSELKTLETKGDKNNDEAENAVMSIISRLESVETSNAEIKTIIQEMKTAAKSIETDRDSSIASLREKVEKMSDMITNVSELNAKFPELENTLRELIAQEKAKFDDLSARFPALESSLTQARSDLDTKLKVFRDDLNKNSSEDKQFKAKVYSYVDGLLRSPSLSEYEVTEIRKRIYTTWSKPVRPSEEDYVYQYNALETDKQQQDQYMINLYTQLTGCEITSKNEILSAMPLKLASADIDNDDMYELLWFIYYYETIVMNRSPLKLLFTNNEFSVDTSVNQDKVSENIILFNKYIELVDLPPIENNTYSYFNAKSAAIRVLKRLLFDCETFYTGIYGESKFCLDLPNVLSSMTCTYSK